ncbi:MAG: ogr/Delta-like zinc finger family protein [Pigmentiphaga sp.]
MSCPHCQHKAIVRRSREMSRTMRELTFVCRNLDCNYAWVSVLEAHRSLNLPPNPDPSVVVPLSPHVNRRRHLDVLNEPCQGELF